jgi:CheY-like chemotaxis protein
MMNGERYIMLADDDGDDRMLFEDAVREINGKIKINISADGVQLMDSLIEKVSLKPDIIFLDINMPKKNGFDCLMQIRASQNLKDIPVIIYSTCSQEETVNKAFECGANFFLRKPDSFGTLKKILLKILNTNFSFNSTVTPRDKFIITT